MIICFKDHVFYLISSSRLWLDPFHTYLLPPLLTCFQFLKGAKLFLLEDLPTCPGILSLPLFTWNLVFIFLSQFKCHVFKIRYLTTESKVVSNIISHSTFFFSFIVISMFCNHILISFFLPSEHMKSPALLYGWLYLPPTFYSTFLNHLVICCFVLWFYNSEIEKI